MSYEVDEESNEHEEIPINDTPATLEFVDDNRVEVVEDNQECVASTSQIPSTHNKASRL